MRFLLTNFLYFLLLFSISCKSIDENVFDVTKFGADSKGLHKSTSAIKQAIDAAVKEGGGTVYFPKGDYLCGPIHLKSNITLHFADNTVIKFSNDFDDYLPMIRVRWEGTVLNTFSPLITAYKQQNIVIKGKAILDGQGSHWWQYLKQKKFIDSKYQKEFFRVNNLTELRSEVEDMSRIKMGFLRPPFIQLFDSTNIIIQDITVRNSPFWNINPVFCDNVLIKKVRIEAPHTSPNTDGIDPDSCRNVTITNVEFDVGDDCIAIKSGRDLQGRRYGRPTDNVLITDCKMFGGISGLAIGSEMSGGVQNITVRNCLINGTDRGIYIKSLRGRGGVVDRLFFNNISMINIKTEGIRVSMFFNNRNQSSHSKPKPFTEGTPVFRNFHFSHISGSANQSVFLEGLPESLIHNISLSKVDLKSKYGLYIAYTENLQIVN